MRAWWSLLAVGCAFRPSPGGPGDGRQPDTRAVGDGAGFEARTPDAAIEPPVLVGKATQEQSNSSAVVATMTGSAAAGDVLVAVITWAGAATVSSLTDSHGTTYTELVSASGGLGCELWFGRAGGTAGADSVMAMFSAPVENRLTVAAYGGVPLSGPVFDGSAAAAVASNTMQVGTSIDTSLANDMLVAIVNSAGTPTAGSGFTAEETTAFSLLEQRVAASPGTYDAGATFTNNNSSCIGLVAIEGF